ncbi:Hsp20/alpha crystallin family protein [Candidatus Halobonum tyrrellensis]|uniref:Hsp20 type chaperone n=1 Tax=Candidatus Halobonum tyrrellensis G22 TaxID=1324957 RepID=V4HI75_9EURY|nr:Hsp20/alpha crystallin family protein [Candidatus Halobonum tyrrellensis]ESP87619.1 hsp20 type chaperone [Candidatus Halobonum tyrrellensis G22]
MRDERDDPFGDIFDEIERMMNEMTGAGAGGDTGFASETHVSVFEGDGSVRVVADLPGIEKEGVDLKCDGTTLTVSAAGGGRQYDERVRLPVHVDEHSANATFNNGVLEVTFDRAEPSAGIDVE